MADEKNVKPKSGKLIKMIVIVLLIIIIAMVSFAGYWFLLKKPKTAGKNVEIVTPTAREIRLEDEKTVEMKEFLVNLSDPTATHYLKLKMFIGYTEKDAKFLEELTKKDAQIRDVVLSILRSKTSKDFDNKGTDKLKKETLDKINELLIKGQLTSIYINDIFIQ